MDRYFRSVTIAFIFLALWVCTACTRNIKPDKFDVDFELIKPLNGTSPVNVWVPAKADEKYEVEFVGKQKTHATVFVNLNDLYKNAKDLLEDVLTKSKIPVTADASKKLKFTISKVQWEVWAGGFAIGSYLEFDVETGDGYRKHFKVQDQSSMGVERAVGGTTSRAVEAVF